MTIDSETADQLAATRTIDLTTRGRRTGNLARVEIWWFRVDGRFIITGTPGPRDWYANVLADPNVIIHANGDDHAATAYPVSDPGFRRRVFTDREISWYKTQAQLDALVSTAPMIEIVL